MFADTHHQTDWNEVISKLKEKGANLPCPRCGKLKFNIVGETDITITPYEPVGVLPQNLLMQVLPQSITKMPSFIPVIILGCDNCGYLIQHAKGPLGLSR